jgi:hypothetical protein
MKPAIYAPIYAAALYPQWAEIAREHGYALAVHGSLARDFDLIAIPWADEPKEPEAVIEVITSQFAAKLVGGPPSDKPHGRRVWTLSIGFGECFADLSFMPRVPLPSHLRPDWIDAEDAVGGVLAAGALVERPKEQTEAREGEQR